MLNHHLEVVGAQPLYHNIWSHFKWGCNSIGTFLIWCTPAALDLCLKFYLFLSLPIHGHRISNMWKRRCYWVTHFSLTCFLAGSYAEWISAHPQVLGSVLPLMLQGLRDTNLAQPATLSLKEVVRENQEHLHPFVADILAASKVCCRLAFVYREAKT